LFFPHPPTTRIYTLSLHDALPISRIRQNRTCNRDTLALSSGELHAAFSDDCVVKLFHTESKFIDARNLRRPENIFIRGIGTAERSEEHTSELQSRFDLVCRLLLEK